MIKKQELRQLELVEVYRNTVIYLHIGEAVNLCAKLEKHNKELGVRGTCDAATYDLALRQGFEPPAVPPDRRKVAVQGVGQEVELVILVR